MNPITATDYKATSIQGKQRVYGGKFSNPMGGVPSVNFDEELITYDSATDTVFRNQAGGCQAALTDPAKPLTLRSPVDDTEIPLATFIAKLQSQGQFTNEDFFVTFYSLARRAQLARDAYNAAVRVQAEAQAVYDLEQSEASFATLNAAIAATEAARGGM
jgi:hypothetical protein